jgi:hypothetical protein
VEKVKGRSLDRRANLEKEPTAIITWRNKRRANLKWRAVRSVEPSRTACSLAANEAAPIVARFYSVTSRQSEWTGL